MKKNIKSLLFVFLALFFMGNVSAKLMSSEDVENISKYTEGTDELYQNVYILGKHVHFNSFTTKDTLSAARTILDANDPTMYFKDGENKWTDFYTEKSVDKKNLSFDMVELIGEKDGKHISTDENLYKPGNGYVKDAQTLEGRTIEMFDEENGDIRIVNIRPISKTTLENPVHTNILTHNMQVMDFNYNRATKNLVLKENEPLINGVVGILIETNKKLSAEDFNDASGNELDGDFVYEKEFGADAAKYGANENEFVMWLNLGEGRNDIAETDTDSILGELIMAIENEDSKLCTSLITIEYKPVEVIDGNGRISKTHVIEPITKDILVSNTKLTDDGTVNAQYIYTKNHALKEGYFKLDGNKFYAFKSKEDNKWYGGLSTEMVKPVKANVIDKANEGYFEQQTVSELDVKDLGNGEFDVFTSIAKDPKFANDNKYAVVMDFGIEHNDINLHNIIVTDSNGNAPTELIIDATDLKKEFGITSKSAFVLVIDAADSNLSDDNNKGYKIIVENQNIPTGAYTKEKYIFNFKSTYDFEKMNVNIDLADKNLDIYNPVNSSDGGAEVLDNYNYKQNMNSLNINTKYEKIDDAGDQYHVSVRSNKGELEELTANNQSRYYLLTIDLGNSDLENIKIGDGQDLDVINPKNTISKDQISILNNKIYYWISNINTETMITINNILTKESIEISINLYTITQDYVDLANPKEQNVKINSKYSDRVFLHKDAEDNNKILGYDVNSDVDLFEATEGNKEYVFGLDENSWNHSEKLKLENTYKDQYRPEYIEADTNWSNADSYNMASVDKVTHDGNIINVKLNRKLANHSNGNGVNGEWYAIVVDFGIKNSLIYAIDGYTIEDDDKALANYHVIKENESDNNIIIWLNAEDTDDKDGKTIKFVNNSANDMNNVGQEFIIKSTYNDNELNLNLKNVRNISTTAGDLYGDNIFTNSKYLNPSIVVDKEGKKNILVEYDKPFEPAEEVKSYGLLIDLGISHENISMEAYSNVSIISDDELRAKYGAKDTEVVVKVTCDSTEPEVDLENIIFKNNHKDNKNDRFTLNITYKNSIEDFIVNNVSLINKDAKSLVGLDKVYYEAYNANQKAFDFKYTLDDDNKIGSIELTRKADTDVYDLKVVDPKAASKKLEGKLIALELKHNAKEISVEPGRALLIDNVLWIKTDGTEEIEITNNYNQRSFTITTNDSIQH